MDKYTRSITKEVSAQEFFSESIPHYKKALDALQRCSIATIPGAEERPGC